MPTRFQDAENSGLLLALLGASKAILAAFLVVVETSANSLEGRNAYREYATTGSIT